MFVVTGLPLGYQHLAPTSATALAPPKGAKQALISISTASVNMRDDGIAPTTAVGGGLPLPSGSLFLYASDFAELQFISATGLVDVAFYG